MIKSLVNDGELEQGLKAHNSKLLMWLGLNHGLEETPAQMVYDYFTQYITDSDLGYYWQGNPKFQHQIQFTFLGTIGIINLQTGELMHWYGGPPPTTQQILDYAALANQPI